MVCPGILSSIGRKDVLCLQRIPAFTKGLATHSPVVSSHVHVPRKFIGAPAQTDRRVVEPFLPTRPSQVFCDHLGCALHVVCLVRRRFIISPPEPSSEDRTNQRSEERRAGNKGVRKR